MAGAPFVMIHAYVVLSVAVQEELPFVMTPHDVACALAMQDEASVGAPSASRSSASGNGFGGWLQKIKDFVTEHHPAVLFCVGILCVYIWDVLGNWIGF